MECHVMSQNAPGPHARGARDPNMFSPYQCMCKFLKNIYFLKMHPSHAQVLLANRLKRYNLLVRKMASVNVRANFERRYKRTWIKLWSKS